MRGWAADHSPINAATGRGKAVVAMMPVNGCHLENRGGISDTRQTTIEMRNGKRLRRGAPERPVRRKPYRRLCRGGHADHVLASFKAQHEATSRPMLGAILLL